MQIQINGGALGSQADNSITTRSSSFGSRGSSIDAANWRHISVTKSVLALATVALLVVQQSAISEEAHAVFDPSTGYRIARYRAPVRDTPPGGKRIWVDELERIVAENSAILIDVMPSTGPGPNPKTGDWRMTKNRENIPGSVWLPDVGDGKIDGRMIAYFRDNLARLTQGDPSRKIVVYCQADCWMSWNAVKRAASFGYTNLFWYPEGTDGWRDWVGTFAPATPVRLQPVK